MKQLLHLIVLAALLAFLGTSCKKESSCEGCNEGNKPPIARAGRDTAIASAADSLVLDGSASSDPDGTITAWQWTKIAGPSAFKVTQANTARAILKELTRGIYWFQLAVTDNKGAIAKDTVQVYALITIGNKPPVANAGNDVSITLPQSALVLDGTASTDVDGTIIAWDWTEITGPSTVQFTPSGLPAQKNVSGLVEGTYAFELKVTDNDSLWDTDTVQVEVKGNPVSPACDNSNRPQVAAQLIPLGNLSKKREDVCMAIAGNKILMAGGFWTPDCPECWGSPRVDIYDLTTSQWSTAELSVGRGSIGVATVGSKVFFAGGQAGDGADDTYYDNVDIYDTATDKWSVIHVSQPRAYIAVGAAGNKVIFAGGEYNWNYATSNVVDVYDLSTGNLSTAQLSEARANSSAVTAGTKVYVAGGSKEDRWYSQPSNKIDIYDAATGTWSVSNLVEPMLFPAGLSVGQTIYWAAGCAVEIKDLATGTSSGASLYKQASWDLGAVVKDDQILFLGGYRGTVTNLVSEKKFDIYNTTSNTWSIGILPLTIQTAVTYNNMVYATDGEKLYKLEF